jgi:hypothetical protein
MKHYATVTSATVSAEHTLKHFNETTKEFPVTKPSMLLYIHTKPGIFTLKQKIFVPNTRGSSLRT